MRLSLPEMLVILFVVLLLFGSKRLPDLARSLGKSLSEFKKGKEEGERELPPKDGNPPDSGTRSDPGR